MHKVKYALFYDNHTHMENPDVGKNFDPEHFVGEAAKCGVDYIAFHARCNAGMAYYDTKIGTRHPSLTYDLFGKLAESCRKRDIALVAYFNGGISTMELADHREWRTQYFPGQDRFGEISPFSITACYNSSYRDHLISMIREVASNYPVQGFFVDCLLGYPCICPTCIRMMQEHGIDFNDLEAVKAFSKESVLRLCKDIASAVKEIIPDPMLYFNGPLSGNARDCDTFFDCECLPTSEWGYEFLPTMAHFIRNIKPGMQILNMTGRFYDWGDFGGLRPAESLKYDLIYGMAHGMRPNVGGHFHPRGDKDQAVFDRINEVYTELRQYDKYLCDAVNLTDTAVICPKDDYNLRQFGSLRSAVRMLEELKIQFDVVIADSVKSWEQYKLLILPENVEITSELARRVREHISRGGAFFACGESAAKEFGAELGVKYQGASGYDAVYFNMNGDYSDGLEDMYLSLYAPACAAQVTDGVGESRLVKPYYNREWKGTHSIFYLPPQEEVDLPFIVRRGNCIWCAGDIFSGYANRGALHLRHIVRNVIFSLLEEPLVKVGKLPACSRVVLNEKDDVLSVSV
ncbi:MAG: alpha-L-fucosidase, partial [Lentisphaeria bacterium]|nr:alpha-L-fucosidase [Lentisphaeria bacterium]